MNNDLIIVKVLINRVSFKPILINTGYEYCFIVDKDFIIELRLPCHGASCMQANGAEGRKNDRWKKEEKERI